jgi:serine/threonine-protein kinase
LWRIGASGTEGVERLTALGPGEASHRWPEALPGGVIAATIWPPSEDVLGSTIALYEPARAAWHRVAQGTYPRYSTAGRLFFSHDGQLFSTTYHGDPAERGPVQPVQSLVLTSEQTGFVHYAVSASTLVYSPGGLQSEMRRLVWVDRNGTVTPAVPAARGFDRPRLSPDGRMLAITVRERGNDIYTYDLARGVMTRLTHGEEGEHEVPVWSPDGSRLIYTAWTSGRERSYVVVAPGGTQPPQVIARTNRHEHVTEWSLRRGLAIVSYDAQGRGDIVFMDAAPPSPRVTVASTPHNERDGRLSPDGAWLAYVSDESGRDEVYVREVSGIRRLQVSDGGGTEPVWRRDGRALFYRSPAAVMEVDWPITERVQPRSLFKDTFARTGRRETNYDVSADGSRLLMVEVLPKDQPPLMLVTGIQ